MVIVVVPPKKLSGELVLPGDKSITHRSVMLGSLAGGVTEVRGYLDAGDCRSTIKCMQALGARISPRGGGRLLIEGLDMKLNRPEGVLDAGNSGTTARLLLGILAGQPFESSLTGDSSLRKRPMKRVCEPLSRMGAHFPGGDERLPLVIRGGELRAITHGTHRASAQVKSAILLAGLYAEGYTTVEEPLPSRNHTELMLAGFGVELETSNRRVSLKGRQRMRGRQVIVPGDISAAAFFMVAAAILPEAEVLLKNVGVNPTRSGIIDTLRSMGADLEMRNPRRFGEEPVADILVRGGAALRGINLKGEMIPRLIDEIPVLAVAAAVADGVTEISDAGELRVKETDRISDLARQLSRLGARVREKEDGLVIEGGARLKGAAVDSCGDHRIAMAMAVAGLAASGETSVHGAEAIGISFPGFMASLRSLADG